MLSFFRRIINSKAGIVVTFVVLGVIALAFAAGDVTGLRPSGGGLTGSNVATVGKGAVSVADFKSAVGNRLDAIRQQQPSVTIAEFAAQGGLDATLDQAINGLALDQFGHAAGMQISKRLVDGQIASIPGLQGPTGQFDQRIYEQLLSQRRLTDRQIRADIARDMIGQQLLRPALAARFLPEGVALPYASLLLEKRSGQAALIPAAAVASGAAPTDAELQTFYQRNIARYTLPERRVLKYALVGPAAVAGRVAPTDAEIAKAYNDNRTRFAASEKRTITQVTVLDQAGANALAAKVKSGTPIADAARAAGLEASTQAGVDKAAYAGTTSAQVADAVFAAQRGGVVGPVRGGIGWIVAKVDSIEAVAGKSLDQARPDLVAELTKQKTLDALTAVRNAIDDSLSNNATFDEAVADQKLTAQSTPAITAQGIDPLKTDAKPDPALAPVVSAGFQLQEGDQPQMVQTGPDGSFALVGIGSLTQPTPRALADVRAQVDRDFRQDRARAEARRLAADVVAKVNKGTPLAQALSGTGRSLPAPRPLAASRAELAANPRAAAGPLVLMFSMEQGQAKLIEAPDGSGWYVVRLDRIDPANAAANPAFVAAARRDLAGGIGREYAAQFVRAIRDSVGVKIDKGAVARVRTDLTGGGPN
jgi:peptidyl-prolyl cis-trans isomerase D